MGGGIAGVSAATVLAERGIAVTLLEQQTELGGRAGAWTDHIDGHGFEMERGFHAFFRQYYNLRALLRRVDPKLEVLTPMEDYPILGKHGAVESFIGLPNTPPFNVIALTRRTPYLGWRDLTKVNARAALDMMRFDPQATYEKYDSQSAKQYLDSLGFPPKARAMMFNVFAHSFFNPEAEMSAAELLMMFHFYFMGNPEGLIFDVAKRPFSTAIWRPFAEYLRGIGASIQFETRADSVERTADGWQVSCEKQSYVADMLVLALPVPALCNLVTRSDDLSHPAWCKKISSLSVTNPFAVWRLWLDKPSAPGRAPFAGTTEHGCLDNISLFHLLEDESREWAQRTGGSVVELHAYAIEKDPDHAAVKAELLAGLHALYPETRSARIVHERWLVRRDCPAFAPGSHALRPGVETPFSQLALAGDFVRIPMPSALMERAAASGFLAANSLLSAHRVVPEPVQSVPRRGLLSFAS